MMVEQGHFSYQKYKKRVLFGISLIPIALFIEVMISKYIDSMTIYCLGCAIVIFALEYGYFILTENTSFF